MRLRWWQRLLGYRVEEDGESLTLTFPRWYPDAEITRKTILLGAEFPDLVGRRVGLRSLDHLVA